MVSGQCWLHNMTSEAFFDLLFSGINCTESVLVFLKDLVEFTGETIWVRSFCFEDWSLLITLISYPLVTIKLLLFFLIPWICLFRTFYTVTQYGVFCIWLFSPSMCSRFIYTVVQNSTYSFSWLNNMPSCSIFYIIESIDKDLILGFRENMEDR